MNALTRTLGAHLSNVPYPMRCISRNASTLAILEVRNGQLSSDSARTITAAARLEGPVTALLLEGISTGAAEEAASIRGLTNVIAGTQEQDHVVGVDEPFERPSISL
jgi:electron transfer flavoprotein alpha subunit